MDKALAVSPTLREAAPTTLREAAPTTLREAAPMSHADVDGWVRYWAENGLFGRQAAGLRL